MRTFLALFTLGCSSAVGNNVAYFRNHNMDRSSNLLVSDSATSVTLNEWDTTINIFDSAKDVKVQRLDVFGKGGSSVSLYSKAAPLQLPEGPIYIFHNSTQLVMTDASTDKSFSAAKTDAVAWISKGACMQLSVELDSEEGEASLIIISSGSVNFTGPESMSQSCKSATVLVGAGLQESGGSGSSFFYNEVKYTLTESSECSNPLTHGDNGYSQTDQPIGPLAAHYHTRGAIYYNQYGTSKYNDEAKPNDTLYKGELRFVNAGVYYGPEEMDMSTAWVSSVHEPDPAAVNPSSESPTSECPFACMNKLGSTSSFSKCSRKSSSEVVV